MARMGFVQADPIRCPARAQDFILRHRVKGIRIYETANEFEQALSNEERFGEIIIARLLN